MFVHVGRVWSDGDPFLVIDRGLVHAWRVQIDDYERLVVDAIARGEVELAIGDGRGVLLGHEARARWKCFASASATCSP